MKILFVESYPQVIFGQQRTLLSLLSHCAEAGMTPTVAVTGEGVFTDRLRNDGYDVAVFDYPDSLNRYGGAIYRDGIRRRLNVIRQTFDYILRIRRRLRTIAPDVIYCNDMRGLLTTGVAARTLGIPVVTWDKLDKPHGILDWFQLPLVRRNPIISMPVAGKYPAWQRRLYGRKIERVSNGVDLTRFTGLSNIRSALGFGPDDVLVAQVGTVTHRKGQDRIIPLMRELVPLRPHLHLLIAGAPTDDAEDQRYFDQLKCENAPHVHFLGMRDDVPELLHSSDMMIIASRHEGMGQVTVEAMAAGIPVIGSNVGGIPEVVVDGETGLIVDGDDSRAWIRAILQLADDPELRARMGQAGRRRVEASFSRPRQMRRVLEICREAAGTAALEEQPA